MDLGDITLYFSVAVAASAMNAVAGGGTFLAFPVLILSGLSPLAANIACTVGLWSGTIASLVGYRGQLDGHKKRMIPFLFISLIGAILGSLTLLETPEVTFKQLVPWLLLGATLVFTFGKHGLKRLNIFQGEPSRGRMAFALFLQLLIAFYGGYFGAGIGILMLAMLQILGLSAVHQMNALKAFLGAMINGITALIFVLMGDVIWEVALVMAIGSLAGGYLGARTALKIPPQYVRTFVSAVGFSMTAYFFLQGM